MTQETRVRRVRARGVRVSLAGSSKLKALEQSLQSIAKNMIDQENLKLEIERQQQALFTDMKKHKIPHVEIEKAVADITRKMGKASNFIDPKVFFNKVNRDEFFSAVTVSITKAKDVLPGKVLETITQNTPGKLGDELLEIKLKKDGKRSN